MLTLLIFYVLDISFTISWTLPPSPELCYILALCEYPHVIFPASQLFLKELQFLKLVC